MIEPIQCMIRAIPCYYTRHNTLQLSNHLVALLQPGSGVGDQLVDDSLGRLLVVHNSGNLAHEVRAGVVHRVIINIVVHVLKVVLNGDDTLGGQLLDLLGPVLLPVLDVGVVADAERTSLT